jgi:putative transposase
VTRYRWVTARKAEGFPITMACTVAGVSRQAFRDWRARSLVGPTAVELAEAELVEVMREIHADSDATYGEARMTTELARRGRVVNHKRVRRLMRHHGIVGVHKPARARTTIPAEENPSLPDLVDRRFAPAAPDVVGVATLDMVQSVGRTGVCWDNAVAESFWSSLKREVVHRYRFADRAAARRAITRALRRRTVQGRRASLL